MTDMQKGVHIQWTQTDESGDCSFLSFAAFG